MANKFLSGINVTGTTTLNTVANAGTDTDKFLVLDASGNVDFRTGDELYADLGIGSLPSGFTSTVKHAVKAGVALTKGQAVYVTGADGTNMIVGKASNASEATSSKTMGLIETTLSINGIGNVITEGLLTGLDTTGATNAGDPVWLGTDGNLIYGLTNKPYAPAHLVFIGIVTRRNANNGEIFVKVQNGFELNEIHDVDLKTTTPINGHILGYDGTLWVNKTIAGWLGYTPQAQLTLTTTGSSGAATLVGATLNIPNYSPDLSNYVTLDTTQLITGTKQLQNGAVLPSRGGTNQGSIFINTFNIEEASGGSNRFGFNDSNNIYFNKGILGGGINGGVISFNNTSSRTYTLQNASGTLAFTSDLHNPVTIGTANGLSLSGQVLSLALASTSATGALSSTDWNTFNGKQNALTNPITGTGTTNYIPKFTASGTIGNSLIYDTGTRIAIGGTSATNGVLTVQSDAGQFCIQSNTTPGKQLQIGYDHTANNSYLSSLNQGVSFTPLFLQPNGGNVGVGTTTDNGARLQVTGTATISSTLQSGSITIKDGGNNGQGTLNLGSTNGYFIQGGADYTAMNFYTNATERMRITSGGNVGIGTSSPNSLLHLNSSASVKIEMSGGTAQNGILFNAIGSSPQYYFGSGNNLLVGGDRGILVAYNVANGTAAMFYNAVNNDIIFGATNSSERMRITSGGAVCVNRTSGSGKFNIDGAFYMYNMTAGAGLSTLKYHTGTGEVTYDTSARIYKKDIVNLEYGLESVLKMNPKKYKWKSNNEQDLGFIADEMHQVIPEIVFLADNKVNKTELQDGEPMGINYDRLIPVLVKAIQELKAEIDELKNK